MAVISIDGPVGLRGRTRNVKNNAKDQGKVIQLLATIPESQGGKKAAWAVMTPSGSDGICPKLLADAIWDFQVFWKAKGVFHNIDGVVDPGKNTLKKLNELAAGLVAGGSVSFICGPDVTEQIATTWTQIQNDFRKLTVLQQIQSCNTILLPFKNPDDPDNSRIPTDLEKLKQKIQRYADIDGWDTLPLFQGESEWLRTPPVFDPVTNGPCATPSSSDYNNKDPFAAGHEDPDTCSNTVQVARQCWLNGSVNYGTFGVMVKLCSDLARTNWILNKSQVVKAVYSLDWAKLLIKAYKKFGQNPEGAIVPIAWTEATFNGGVRGVPRIPGNRTKCKCSCGCKGDVTTWDYIWKPMKSGGRSTR